MLTDEERNDIESTLLYGDPFGNANVTQPLRRKVLELDSEARRYKEALEMIEAVLVDTKGRIPIATLRLKVQHETAFALRGECIGMGQHRKVEQDAPQQQQ